MPWTVSEPPRPAQGRSLPERRACVAAANGTLERTGDEGRAVQACVVAMRQVRTDAVDRKRRRRREYRSDQRRVPEPRLGALQAQFFSVLNRLLKAIQKATSEIVLPALKPLADESRARLGLTTDAPQDEIDRMREEMRQRLRDLVPDGFAEAEALDMASTINNTNRNLLRMQFKAIRGVDIFQDAGVTNEIVQNFARQNARLIRTIESQHLDRVQETIERGFRAGSRSTSIARDIARDFKVTKNRAKLIARDQTSKLNGELTRARQMANGVTHFIWRTVGDERVRDEHADIEGQRFSWETGAPGEGIPGEPINCRCFAEPVFAPSA